MMRVLIGILVSVALSACTLAPRYRQAPRVAASPDWIAAAPATSVDPNWWRALKDPELSGLVDAALAHNLDLRAAAAHVREARANRDGAFGQSLPQLALAGAANRNELSANGELPINRIPGFSRHFNLFDAGFDASWEIDFWGRNARGVEAANARVASATEALRDVQVQTIAEVVRTYVDLRSAQARLASAARDSEARDQTAALVSARLKAGEAARSDEAMALQQSSAARSEVAGLRADTRAAAYRLALLTARPPEALVALAEQTETPVGNLVATLDAELPEAGAGLRSDVLRRRPDVRQAERELAAATADVGVATADYFPRITLLGSIGQQSRDTGNFFSASSTRYQFGPSLSWPIFSAGSIRARVKAAGARADAAAALYEKAVLTALSDSETALNRYAEAGAQRRDLASAREHAALALDLAGQRYQAGEDDLPTLLAAQSGYSAVEQSALAARAAELAAFVSLYKALGGGWESTGQ
jgi:NodT family efflux transporter outer membrane factor (OMF) lipoprotein